MILQADSHDVSLVKNIIDGTDIYHFYSVPVVFSGFFLISMIFWSVETIKIVFSFQKNVIC